jgi:DNA invertase Pin-like site-specific DNA recombinase
LVDGYLATGDIFFPVTRSDRHDLLMYAARRGLTLVRVVRECAPAPGTPRPKLLDAVGRVESGDIDGIIAPSLWHVGASLREVAAVVERVTAARGTFFSLRENFDTSTPAGRIAVRILASFADL